MNTHRLDVVRPVVALLTVTLVACGDPTSPQALSAHVSPQFAAAVQESGEGVFDGSGVFFLPCLGEALRVESKQPYTYHRTVTSSGIVVFADHFIHHAATGTAVGLTSGRTWTLARVASPEVILVAAGEVAHFTANIWWASTGDGPSFNLHSLFHFSQNANGDVTVDRFEVRCKLH